MPDNEQTIADAGLEGTSLATESTAATAKAQADAPVAPITPLSNQIQQGAAPAKITNQDLFPGMNQNINVGSSSSKTLGSQPIFVAAGQYVPYNILNKKDEAIATATKKRAERQARFDPGKAGKLNNQLYQRKLNDRFNEGNSEYIKYAQSMDPDNWDKNLNNPGTDVGKAYAQFKSNMEVLATESNVIFDKAASVMANKEKGGVTAHSAETRALAEEVQNRTGSAAEGGLEDLRPFVDKFNGSYDLDAFIAKNKFVTQMKADIESDRVNGGGGITIEQEAYYTKRIEQLAESETASNAGRYYQDDIIKKQDIIDRLGASLGTQKTKKFKRDPAPTTYDKKGVEEKEDVKDRFEKVEYIRGNPRSEEAITALGGMVGNKWGTGEILEIDYSHPEEFIKYDDEADKILNVFEDAKDKYGTGELFTWNKSKIETIGKEAVIGALKELGKGSNSINSVKKGEGSNIIIETGTEKVTIDLGAEDKGKSDLSKLLVKYGKEREAVGTRGGSKVRVKTIDGKRVVTEYVDVEDPRLFKLTNASLNTGKAENLKVKQADIDKLLKSKKLKQSQKKTETEVKPSTLAELKSSGQYDDSVKRTMNDAKVGKAEAIKMIEAHYKNKK